MVLEDLQVILGTTSKDILLTIYIRKAHTLITNYLNQTVEIDFTTLYEDAVIDYVVIQMNKKGNEGLNNYSQGGKSGTYGNALPDSTKALLPLPSVRMM